jgi:hypothetical protein
MAKKTIDENLFDRRIVSRHIKRGLVADNDFQKHLESLEDCAEFAEDCETVFSMRPNEEEEAAPAS